jgi:4'-phosphopantetheinyl transferase EntD
MNVSLGSILPSGVVTVECGPDAIGSLRPEEAAAIQGAGESRRREFARSRACAHRALMVLGRPAAAILSGASRQPLWPAGVVGSITHCAGFCAATVADATRWRAIGIDAELHVPLPAGVLALVAAPEEQQALERMPRGDIHWDCLLFSAKESVYKAWFPLTGMWLEFADVLVSFDAAAALFRACVRPGGDTASRAPRLALEGRYMIANGRVHTAVALAGSDFRRDDP